MESFSIVFIGPAKFRFALRVRSGNSLSEL